MLRNNTSPDAVDDEVRIQQGGRINIPVLVNDSDADGDSIWVSIHTQGSHSERVVQNSDGTIHYRPLTEFYGTDQFTYTIVDGFGGSDQANVLVLVTPNVQAQPDTAITDEDVTTLIPVLANDLGSDSLRIIGVDSATNGSVQLQNDSTLIYSPIPDFNGIDTFTYTVSDLQDTSSALVTIIIKPINDPPIAIDDSVTTREGVIVSIDALKNDLDIDGDPLRISEVSAGMNGAASLNPDGTISYLPQENFTGEDHITYLVIDGQGGATTGQIVVVILGLGEGSIGPMALDLNPDFGDQQQRKANIAPGLGNQIIIDIVAISGIRDNIGFQAILRYDASLLRFVDVEGIDLMAKGVVIPPTPSEGIVEIHVALRGQTASRDSGSLGHVTFDALSGFSGQTEVELVGAQYNEPLVIGPGGSTVVIVGTGRSPSPDFDGDGSVGFQDFIQFASAFGSQTGGTRYDTRLDLDVSGDIGFPDFILFAQAFGQTTASKKAK